MAERSNIFVRIRAKNRTSDKNYKMETFFGLYYDWCYGERMISRLRSAIKFADSDISGWYGEYVVGKELTGKFKRYLAVNFDMQDIVDTVDLIDDLRNKVMRGNATENTDIFDQLEDHGFIYIDITLDDPDNKFGENKAKIKYAFVYNEYKDKDGKISPVRSVENFADHDMGNDVRKWYEPDPYWEDKPWGSEHKENFLKNIVPTTKKNIAEIEQSATLMTEDDRKDFVKFGRAYTRNILKEVENKKQEIAEKRKELIDSLNNLAGNYADDTNYIKLMHLISATFPPQKPRK